MVATPGSFSVVKGLPVLLYYKPLFPRAYNFALLNQSARTWCTSVNLYDFFNQEKKTRSLRSPYWSHVQKSEAHKYEWLVMLGYLFSS